MAVDAGVHPVIAAMRLGQKQTVAASVHVVDGIDLKAQPWDKGKKIYEHGYTYNRKNGPASGAGSLTDPTAQIDRLVGHGVNTQDYMKQAKKLGMNPVAAVLRQESGPGLPDGSPPRDKKTKKKKDKKKGKKKKSDKKKKDKKKDKKKSKKKKESSSSSDSSSDADEGKEKGKKKKESSSSGD